MIEDDRQLERARNYLKSMEDIVASMRKENMHPDRFRVWVEPYLSEIHKTRLKINEYLGIKAAEEERSLVWVKLQGPSIIDGAIPAKLLSDFAYYFQQSVYHVARSIAGFSFAQKREINIVELEKNCRLLVVATEAASFQIGFEFEKGTTQLQMFKDPDIPLKSLATIIKIAALLAMQKAETLDDLIPDIQYQTRVLETLKHLTPAKFHGIDYVELRSRREKEVTFDLNVRKYIRSLTKKPEEEIREARGTVLVANFVRKHFEIKQADEILLKCKYSDEELEDAIISAMKHCVIVTGTATVDPKTKKTKQIRDVIDIKLESENQTSQGNLF